MNQESTPQLIFKNILLSSLALATFACNELYPSSVGNSGNPIVIVDSPSQAEPPGLPLSVTVPATYYNPIEGRNTGKLAKAMRPTTENSANKIQTLATGVAISRFASPSDLSTGWLLGESTTIVKNAFSVAVTEDPDGFYDQLKYTAANANAASTGMGWASTPFSAAQGQAIDFSVGIAGTGMVRISAVSPDGQFVYWHQWVSLANTRGRVRVNFNKPNDGIDGAVLLIESVTQDEAIYVGGIQENNLPAPTLTITQPATGQPNYTPATVSSYVAKIGEPIVINFSQTMNRTILLVATGLSFNGPIWNADATQATFTANGAVDGNTYFISIIARAADGRALTGSLASIRFSGKNQGGNTGNIGGILPVKAFGTELYSEAGSAAYKNDLFNLWANTEIDVNLISRGTGGVWFKPEDLIPLKRGGKTKVLGYVCISQGQPWEVYWDKTWSDPPPFALAFDYRWGVWNVDQSNPVWIEAMRTAVDHAINSGFDGIYMDVVTAYWVPGYPDPGAEKHHIATLNLIENMRALAASRGRPDFLFAGNGGTETMNSVSSTGKKFVELMDMLLLESTSSTSSGGSDVDNIASGRTAYVTKFGARFLQESNGKPILGLNSTVGKDWLYDRTIKDMLERNWVPYTAPGNYNQYRW